VTGDRVPAGVSWTLNGGDAKPTHREKNILATETVHRTKGKTDIKIKSLANEKA